jgi:hypothetical protein
MRLLAPSRIAGVAACLGLAVLACGPATAAVQAGRPAAASKASPAPRSAASPALAPLGFLLGDYQCTYTDLTAVPPSTTEVAWNTHAILGGAYLRMDLSGAGYTGQWVFGWNPVDAQFASYYYDTQATIGTTTSPGWSDGHLVFQGSYSAFGHDLLSRDDFTVVDARRFEDRASIAFQAAGPWTPLSDIACRKTD